METNIAEYAIKNIHVGDRLNISISSDLNATQREGKITFIAPVADSASGLVSVKIEFENKDYSVTPGVLGTIEL
jgi:multidrug efflux pump subunit AcrA (membrane-fusion protein)